MKKSPIVKAVEQMQYGVVTIIQLAENIKAGRSPTFSLRRQSIKILIEAHLLQKEIQLLHRIVGNRVNAITKAPDPARSPRSSRSK